MALLHYNATLEYATNTLEIFWYDDAASPLAWDIGTTFNIERIDDDTAKYTTSCTLDGNKLTAVVTPNKAILYREGDTIYDLDHPDYQHIYSIKSGAQVYISGKLNLIEVAG